MSGPDPINDTGAGLRNGRPFTVTVVFLSDWACGTGTARHGAVDREVQRDADGLPMLRGKALTAVLRDAAETVAVGLADGAADGIWYAWVEAVFGSQPGASSRQRLDPGGQFRPQPRTSPVPAALQGRPLHLPGPVRAAIAALDERSRVLAREAAVLLRPGVQIDVDRHTAADDTLRVEERAAVGLTVTADWQLTFPGLAVGAPVPWEAELLLRAAARLVDAIGGKRRRGAGRCRVTIAGDEAAGDDAARDDAAGTESAGTDVAGEQVGRRLGALLERVDQARSPAEVVPSAVADPAGATLGARMSDPPVHRHDLRITTLTPLLVARGVLGNMVLTERFVPGTSLLPMVAKALGEQATELITGGRAVVTNATVEIAGERSLPLPRALHRPKDADQDQQLVNLLTPRADDSQRLRPMVGFCVADGAGGIRIAEVDLVTQAHAVVDDGPQRPTEDSGGLFVYEAIAAGTALRCELWLPADADLDTDWLDGEHAIGRSRKDDYGRVRVDVLAPGTPALAARGTVTDSRQLVVWLLSDLLLRGPAGEPVTDPQALAATLAEALRVDLTLPDDSPDRLPAGFLTTRRVESWQRRWSMPRPSLTGLAAGSVVRFDMIGVPDEEALHRVEATGVGDRTAEGYGRLALQPVLLDRTTVAMAAEPAAEPAAVSRSAGPQTPAGRPGATPALVTELVRRGWRRELHRTAAVRVADDALRDLLVPPDVSMAQLGALRTLADRLTAGDDPAQVRGWIAATRRNRARRESWGVERLDLLDRLASGDEVLWSHLGVRPPTGVADELHRPAAGWLLAEVVRAAVERRRSTRGQDSPAANHHPEEVPA
ncbi:RAMP superfamily CRISPR-associated protein [Solwaraspora sp. WMMA2056]|uniref:RAMP superfamily CRISPR-associated protein n=1 Tax=Solwaraspora sp. WMMA2056 TaxID=3015161 RepID=UPI00259BAFBC|nr:RAMP superfamily CRISPR-associated protein [Solwaraspora sp. WMMA2056]WJK38040.1 RAMP superfamily CRISPR-associated protein [Solwaraspora sp. WMMA2056]